MKIFIFTLIIFAVMTAGIFINTYFLGESVEQILSMIELLPSPEDIDDPERSVSVYDISKEFTKNEFFFSITLSHEDINDVKRAMAQLISAYESKDRDAYREHVALLKESVSHIQKLAETSWDSII